MEVAAQAEAVNRDEVYKAIPASKDKFSKAGVKIYTLTDQEKQQWMDKFAIVWQNYKDTNKAAKDINSIFNDWKAAVEAPR
jgi:TRAP-type C4-dicarboxylate transport system substrate-binding protein